MNYAAKMAKLWERWEREQHPRKRSRMPEAQRRRMSRERALLHYRNRTATPWYLPSSIAGEFPAFATELASILRYFPEPTAPDLMRED